MVVSNIRNLWMIHWSSLVEISLYSCIYFLWKPSKRYGDLLWAAYGIYVAVWIIGKFSFEPFYFKDVYSGAVSQIIQIGFGSWILFSISKEHKFEWEIDPRFLVVSGIILYASAALFLDTMYNVMLINLPRRTMQVILLSNFLFGIVQYVIFLQAFLCQSKSASIND
ncbi:MAG: hypothetical protein NTX44_05750 [Ignavibacteriales bacterium]|nr:hypothetical protein [Ignavibacteriales bacterium]